MVNQNTIFEVVQFARSLIGAEQKSFFETMEKKWGGKIFTKDLQGIVNSSLTAADFPVNWSFMVGDSGWKIIIENNIVKEISK